MKEYTINSIIQDLVQIKAQLHELEESVDKVLTSIMLAENNKPKIERCILNE